MIEFSVQDIYNLVKSIKSSKRIEFDNGLRCNPFFSHDDLFALRNDDFALIGDKIDIEVAEEGEVEIWVKNKGIGVGSINGLIRELPPNADISFDSISRSEE